jgi:D-serine deaminase-like pyridoxal phosphate-dependent protein
MSDLVVPTPAPVIDLPALTRNIERMAAYFAARPCGLRPHFKAHKVPEIARRQLAAGACTGLTCATVAEAEAVAHLGADLLVANEVVDAARATRLAALAARLPVTVAVDSPTGLEVVAAAARAAGVTVGVLVDVNVGQDRCGVAPGEAALVLARRVAGAAGVRLRGVMGYEGHVQPVRDRAEREVRAREAMGLLVATAEQLRADGLPCEVVSGGGSGTYDLSGNVPGVSEIQAGSYVLMDTDYAAVGLPFEAALTVAGTVVSRTGMRVVADCGHKALARDHGLPAVAGVPGASVAGLNDEHAILEVPADCTLAVGDRVALRPSHIDPTLNLHDACFVVEDGRVVDVWPIAARGYADQRAALAAWG